MISIYDPLLAEQPNAISCLWASKPPCHAQEFDVAYSDVKNA